MSSDQAPAIDLFGELMGRAAMELKSHARPQLKIYDGDRRRFGDHTPGAASLVSIPGGKENPK